jgi:hypothetical protein
MNDHFWDFDNLDEDGVARRSRDREISLVFWTQQGFIRVFVLGFWDVDPWVHPCVGLVVRDVKVYIGSNVI